MRLLIINHGWIGDSLLASSLAENCKMNGYDVVDLLIGFPQTCDLLKLSPYIDNVFISEIPGSYPTTLNMDMTVYDKVYNTRHLVFNERPLDTFNKDFNFPELKYDFELNVIDYDLPSEKPKIAFQTDWSERSFSTSPRNQDNIIKSLLNDFDILMVGKNSSNGVPSQFTINENTSHEFLLLSAAIKKCDFFFGYPGGLHWLSAGLGIKTITTSEYVLKAYTDNGSFKGLTFEEFKNEWMVHANKNFTNEHILLKPLISDNEIVKFIKNFL